MAFWRRGGAGIVIFQTYSFYAFKKMCLLCFGEVVARWGKFPLVTIVSGSPLLCEGMTPQH